MPKPHHSKAWPVKDVRYVEVALSDLTTRHLHIEFNHGIRIIVANEVQLPWRFHLLFEKNEGVKWADNGSLIEVNNNDF